MGRHAAPRGRNSRRRWLSDRVLAVLGLGMVLALGAVSTSAYWTDQATVAGGTFTAGKLDLKVGDPATDNDPPEFTTNFAMTGMVPGNSKDGVLKVTNAGDVPLIYTVTASATNAGGGADQLGAAIRMTVVAGTDCGATALQSNVAPSAVNVSRPALGGGAAANLCFRATLPAGANTALQGTSTVITLTLNAVQAP